MMIFTVFNFFFSYYYSKLAKTVSVIYLFNLFFRVDHPWCNAICGDLSQCGSDKMDSTDAGTCVHICHVTSAVRLFTEGLRFLLF